MVLVFITTLGTTVTITTTAIPTVLTSVTTIGTAGVLALALDRLTAGGGTITGGPAGTPGDHRITARPTTTDATTTGLTALHTTAETA